MKKCLKKESIISIIATCILFALTIICFDITYALNDDLAIQGIISGTFAGKSCAFTYYLSFPIGLILALLYTIIPAINWMGIFFIACYFVGIYLILKRLLTLREEKNSKAYLFGIGLVVFFTYILSGIVLLHYTVLAAFCGGVGLALFITNTSKEKLLKTNISSLVFILLSYLIREKVFYMMVPFFLVAFLIKLVWEMDGSEEKKFGAKLRTSLKKYAKFLHVLLGAFILLVVLNKIPYLSKDYKEYASFNEARTTLYDYVGVRETIGAMNYYSDHGIDRAEYDLLKSYNIMLDNDMTADVKAMSKYKAASNSKENLAGAIYLYKESVLKKTSVFKDISFFPYNYMIAILYIATLVLIIKHKKYFQLISLIGLGIVRSGLFIYLFYNGRFPTRVISSLFIMEAAVLLAFMALLSLNEKKYSLAKMVPMVTALVLLIGAYYNLGNLHTDYEKQLTVNKNEDVLYSYMANNPQNFYFMDVYASVYRTEKVFKDYKPDFENYMIFGGWLSGHPIVDKKTSKAGLPNNIKECLADSSSRLVTRKDVGWQIEDYENYLQHAFTLEETLTCEDGSVFYVYKY